MSQEIDHFADDSFICLDRCHKLFFVSFCLFVLDDCGDDHIDIDHMFFERLEALFDDQAR